LQAWSKIPEVSSDENIAVDAELKVEPVEEKVSHFKNIHNAHYYLLI